MNVFRWANGSKLTTVRVGEQMGWLLGQVRVRVPVVRRQHRCHVQRQYPTGDAHELLQHPLHQPRGHGIVLHDQGLPAKPREENQTHGLFPTLHERAPYEGRRSGCWESQWYPVPNPLPASVVPNSVGCNYAPHKRHRADQLCRPHENHHVSTDGRGHVHRRRAKLPHVQVPDDRKVRLLPGSLQGPAVRVRKVVANDLEYAIMGAIKLDSTLIDFMAKRM